MYLINDFNASLNFCIGVSAVAIESQYHQNTEKIFLSSQTLVVVIIVGCSW